MIYLLYTIHIIIALFLILVVLLQQGKGADLAVFGGGSTQAAFGARGAATLLHKLTVVGFVLFVVTTLTISLVGGPSDRSSVMGAAEDLEDVTEAQEAELLGQDPGPAPAIPVEEAPGDGELLAPAAGEVAPGGTAPTGAAEPPAAGTEGGSGP